MRHPILIKNACFCDFMAIKLHIKTHIPNYVKNIFYFCKYIFIKNNRLTGFNFSHLNLS